MSIQTITQEISAETAKYAPGILATIIAVEQAAHDLPGSSKLAIVTNVIQAGAATAGEIPNKIVDEIAGLVNMFVGVLHATGIFRHKAAPVAAVPPASSQPS